MRMSIEELSGYYDYTALMKALDDEIFFLCCKSGGENDELIAKRKKELERTRLHCERERERISEYILHDVSDGLVRAMMYARFIKLMPWYKVAMYVGGGNTAESCRMAVFRFCRGKGKR